MDPVRVVRVFAVLAFASLLAAFACVDAAPSGEPPRRLGPGEEAPYFSWPRRSMLPPEATEEVVRSALASLEVEDEIQAVLFVGEFGDSGQMLLGLRTGQVDGPRLELAIRAEGSGWFKSSQAAPAFEGKRALAFYVGEGNELTVVVLADPGVDEVPTAGGELRFRRAGDGVYAAPSASPPSVLSVRDAGDTVVLDGLVIGVEQEDPDPPAVTPGNVAEFTIPPDG